MNFPHENVNLIFVTMIGFLLRILGNSAALYAAYRFVPGFEFSGGIKEFLLAGTILGLLNFILKPVLRFISFPVIILTLGLFSLVINALILWLVDYIFEFMTIADLTALVWSTIAITIVNMLISGLIKAFD